MLVKTERQPLCSDLLEEMLSGPGMAVIIVGPLSCLRTQYFRARHAKLLDRVFFQEVSELSFVTHAHVDKVSEMMKNILHKRNDIKGLILYTACADVISGTNYRKIAAFAEQEYQIPVKIVPRGPLAKRIKGTRERMLDALSEIAEYHLEKEKNTDLITCQKYADTWILPPIACDYTGVATTLYDYNSFDILYSPGCCHTVIREVDESRDLQNKNLHTTKLQDSDIVYSGLPAIQKALGEIDVSAFDFISLIGTFVTDATGVNLKKEALQIEKMTNKKTLYFESHGFNGYSSGVREAFLKTGNHYLNAKEKKKDRIIIQIIGYHPLIHADQTILSELQSLLDHEKAEVVVAGNQPGVSARADLTIVISQEAESLAEHLFSEYGIPYLLSMPLSVSEKMRLLHETERMTRLDYMESKKRVMDMKMNQDKKYQEIKKDQTIVIVGEPLSSVTLKDMLKEEYEAEKITVIACFDKQGKDRKIFNDSRYDEVLFTKDMEEIRRIIEKADLVFADLIFEEHIGNKARFIPVKYPGISGRYD